jgi:hypothetical protein
LPGIEIAVAIGGNGVLAVVGDLHPVAFHLEQFGQRIGGVGVVVDDEDTEGFAHHAASLRAC